MKLLVALYFMFRDLRGLECSEVAGWGSHLQTYKEHSHKPLCFGKPNKTGFQ